MTSTSNIQSLQRYFAARFREEMLPERKRPARGPSVTISREAGAGGVSLGNKLATYLEKEDGNRESVWGLFDRNLVEKVLEDHHLPSKLAKYMEEDAGSEFKAYLGEYLGLHPSISTLIEKTNETIKKLARSGNAIIVGHGANLVTSNLRNTLHVRLTCHLEKRIERIQSYLGVDYTEALEYAKTKERERRDYVKKHFDKRIDDPLIYHLTVNTGVLSDDEVVRIIGDAVLQHAGLLRR